MQPLEPRIMLDGVVDWADDALHHAHVGDGVHGFTPAEALQFFHQLSGHDATHLDAAPPLDVIAISHSAMAVPGVAEALSKEAYVIEYDDRSDNVHTITQKLSDLVDAQGRKIGTLAVLQHGHGGAVTLGGETIHLGDVAQKAGELQSLGSLLAPGGQIQFYACSTAGDAHGQALLEVVSAITGADVFASVNPTGSGHGKDWALEFSTNHYAAQKSLIDTDAMAMAPLELGPGDVTITPVGTQYATVNTPTEFYDAHSGNGILVSDVDATRTLTITLAVDHGVLTVQEPATPPGNTPINYTNSIVSFTATVSDINSALAGLIYTPNQKYDGGDTLTIIAIEKVDSNPGWDMKTVPIVFANADPSIAAPSSVTVQGTGSHLIDGVSVSDPDIGGTAMTVGLSVLHGTLSVPTSTTVSGNNTSMLSITDTLSNINLMLSQLRYTPATGYTGSDTLHITADDLSTPTHGVAAPKDVTLLVGGSSGDPVTAPDIQTVNEDATLKIFPPISVSYPDTTKEMKITLEATHGTLLAGWKGYLSSYTGEGTATLTMTGTQTALNYGLNGARYIPNHDYFGEDKLEITFDPQDGTGPLPAKTTTLHINSINDPPALTVPSVYSARSGAETPIQGIAASDPDVGAGTMSVDMKVLHGTVSTAGHAASSRVTFSDTLSRVNTELGSIIYTSLPSYVGPDFLTITVSDNGYSGAGGALTDTKMYTINVS
ncbi:MAG: DUF4347 domain-containing protein [Desulfomonilaceae bacterium]